LLISGIAILTPRAVYAVVATITRDQDNPARHPFTTKCGGSTGINFFCETPPIPAGQEVVIETISINGFNLPPGDFVYLGDVRTTVAGVTQFYFLNPWSNRANNCV